MQREAPARPDMNPDLGDFDRPPELTMNVNEKYNDQITVSEIENQDDLFFGRVSISHHYFMEVEILYQMGNDA